MCAGKRKKKPRRLKGSFSYEDRLGIHGSGSFPDHFPHQLVAQLCGPQFSASTSFLQRCSLPLPRPRTSLAPYGKCPKDTGPFPLRLITASLNSLLCNYSLRLQFFRRMLAHESRVQVHPNCRSVLTCRAWHLRGAH